MREVQPRCPARGAAGMASGPPQRHRGQQAVSPPRAHRMGSSRLPGKPPDHQEIQDRILAQGLLWAARPRCLTSLRICTGSRLRPGGSTGLVTASPAPSSRTAPLWNPEDVISSGCSLQGGLGDALSRALLHLHGS